MIFTKTISECSQRESPYIEKTVDITILYTTKKILWKGNENNLQILVF